MCHAKTILDVLGHVFGDIAVNIDNMGHGSEAESNDELDELDDDELLGE